VTALAAERIPVVVEPFMSRRGGHGLVNDLTTEAVVRSTAIASALGNTSAYTWLKLPVVDDPAAMEHVAAATTLPIVLLGGEVSDDPDETLARWRKALELPAVRGLTVGRSLLYPPDGDVAAAVDRAVSLLPGRGSA
ncbi:MAG TPA: aldolase, partial [Actinopolymorphaceae bacterium]